MSTAASLLSTRYAGKGAPDAELSAEECHALLKTALDKLKPLKKVLIVPPDITRAHSFAGELTVMALEILGPGVEYDIMPALGTHRPMTEAEMDKMLPGIPHAKIKTHDWRNALVKIGEIPGAFVKKVSEGKVDYGVNVEVNKIILEGKYDLVLSLGQVVPHEVVGLANQNKNIFVGLGGSDTINKSHFLGASYNMERIMGRAVTPVRQVFNECSTILAEKGVHVVYGLTVRANNAQGKYVIRGFFIGDDHATFAEAAALSQKCNLDLLDAPMHKAVVYLRPDEYQSTWLGNKSIYRTRMAMADDGELIVMAPGLKEFGEDKEIDRLIRKYGYRGTPAILDAAKKNEELGKNLSAAAHLIHGSSEGRFKITYCPGPGVSQKEIEGAGFAYGNLDAMMKKYDIHSLKHGFNEVDGEKIFYIANPSLGLWALKKDFP
jgi:nickel-dependent lactate racemase